MSDTQKIVDTLAGAAVEVSLAVKVLGDLPKDEREAIRSASEMLIAARAIINRRIAAHSNALEVQS